VDIDKIIDVPMDDQNNILVYYNLFHIYKVDECKGRLYQIYRFINVGIKL